MVIKEYINCRVTNTDLILIEIIFKAMAWIFAMALLNLPTEIPILAYVVILTLKLKFKILRLVKSREFILILIAFLSLIFNFERDFSRNLIDFVQLIVGVIAAYIFILSIRANMLILNSLEENETDVEMIRRRRSLIRFGLALLLAAGLTVALNSLGSDSEGAGILKTGLTEAKVVFPFAFGVLLVLLPGYLEKICLSILAFAFVIVGNSKAILLTTMVVAVLALGHKTGLEKIISIRTIFMAFFKLITVSLVSLVLLYLFNPERFDDIVNPETSVSTTVRLSLIRTSLKAAIENPILGTGPSGINIPINYDKYHDNGEYDGPIKTEISKGHAAIFENGFTSGAHNGYADLLASYGFIYIILFIYWLFKGGVMAFRRGLLPFKILFVLVVLVYFEWQYSQISYGISMCVIFHGLRRIPIQVKASR